MQMDEKTKTAVMAAVHDGGYEAEEPEYFKATEISIRWIRTDGEIKILFPDYFIGVPPEIAQEAQGQIIARIKGDTEAQETMPQAVLEYLAGPEFREANIDTWINRNGLSIPGEDVLGAYRTILMRGDLGIKDIGASVYWGPKNGPNVRTSWIMGVIILSEKFRDDDTGKCNLPDYALDYLLVLAHLRLAYGSSKIDEAAVKFKIGQLPMQIEQEQCLAEILEQYRDDDEEYDEDDEQEDD